MFVVHLVPLTAFFLQSKYRGDEGKGQLSSSKVKGLNISNLNVVQLNTMTEPKALHTYFTLCDLHFHNFVSLLTTYIFNLDINSGNSFYLPYISFRKWPRTLNLVASQMNLEK